MLLSEAATGTKSRVSNAIVFLKSKNTDIISGRSESSHTIHLNLYYTVFASHRRALGRAGILLLKAFYAHASVYSLLSTFGPWKYNIEQVFDSSYKKLILHHGRIRPDHLDSFLDWYASAD